MLKPNPKAFEIAPYVPGKSKIKGIDNILKLSSNESPFGASPKVAEAIKAHLGQLHRYPDGSCLELREKIASKRRLSPEQIVCGAGSDEIIGLLCYAYGGQGREILFPEYSFLMYKIYALASGSTPVEAKTNVYAADVDNILAAVTEKTSIVFIANPNNPTGTWLDKYDMHRLRSELRDDILLVIDGAYAECVPHEMDDYSTGEELVMRAENNVVVCRTFSKLYGIPSLRVGYGFMPLDVADIINRIRGPFNVSSLGQVGAIAALDDEAHLQMTYYENRKGIKQMTEGLRELGLKVGDSIANFVMVEFESVEAAQKANQHLQNNGIIVRDISGYNIPHALRITIGLEQENNKVLHLLSLTKS